MKDNMTDFSRDKGSRNAGHKKGSENSKFEF